MHGYLKICLDLFYLERHTVSALALCRVGFVSAYSDSVQRAVVSVLRNVSALHNGAVDLLFTVVHNSLPPIRLQEIFCPAFAKI